MLKIFINDLFQSVKTLKIFIKCFFYIFLCFIFLLIIYFCKQFFLQDISFESYNIFLFLVSYIGAIITDYKQQRILVDSAIHKGFWYKLIFTFFNLFFSWPVLFYFASIIFLKEKVSFCIFNYLFFLSSIMSTLCFDNKNLVKLLILCISSFGIIYNNNIIKLIFMFIYIICFLVFFNRCFDEYEISNIKSNVIESNYNHSKLRTSMLIEWLFIIREKKGLLFTSLFCSIGILCFFEYLRRTNPSIFYDLSNIRLLLLASFISGSFITLFGPYMMNWFYFYADDILSKNWLISDIIKGKITFLEISTIVLFVACIPLIILCHINIFMMLYFFVMNTSVSILIALIFGITEISRIDTTKNPRLRVEKGSVLNTYIPWFCEFFSVLIFLFLYGKISIFGIFIFSIIIFGVFYLLNEKIIDRLVILIRKKVTIRNVK